MTFEEWWKTQSGGNAYCPDEIAERFSETAWNAAIAAEREACAKVAEETICYHIYGNCYPPLAGNISHGQGVPGEPRSSLLMLEQRIAALEAQMAELKPKDKPKFTLELPDGDTRSARVSWSDATPEGYHLCISVTHPEPKAEPVPRMKPRTYVFDDDCEPAPRKTLGEIAEDAYCDDNSDGWNDAVKAVAEAIIERCVMAPQLEFLNRDFVVANIRAELK